MTKYTTQDTTIGLCCLKMSAWRILTLGACVNLLATLLGFCSQVLAILDIFTAFRVQYAIALIIFAILFFCGKKPKFFLLCSAGALLNLTLIIPIYWEGTPSFSSNTDDNIVDGTTYKLLMHNINGKNKRYEEIALNISHENSDFLALIEITPIWQKQLNHIKVQYPFQYIEMREDSFGISFYSKHPFLSTQTVLLSDESVPTLVVEAILPNSSSATFIITHPVPPISRSYTQSRNQQLSRLADIASQTNNPLILAGDLNTPPWSSEFTKLIKKGKLRDSRQGFGIHSTWPSYFKLLYTPIDHILISDSINVHDRQIGPASGSDHHSVIMLFSVDID